MAAQLARSRLLLAEAQRKLEDPRSAKRDDLSTGVALAALRVARLEQAAAQDERKNAAALQRECARWSAPDDFD